MKQTSYPGITECTMKLEKSSETNVGHIHYSRYMCVPGLSIPTLNTDSRKLTGIHSEKCPLVTKGCFLTQIEILIKFKVKISSENHLPNKNLFEANIIPFPKTSSNLATKMCIFMYKTSHCILVFLHIKVTFWSHVIYFCEYWLHFFKV